MALYSRQKDAGFSLIELLIVVAVIMIIATIAIPNLLRSRQLANESAAVASLRTIMTAQLTYLTFSGGKYGAMDDLIASKLADGSFPNKGGYVYSIDVASGGMDYTVWANPVSTTNARYGYYTVPDGVVRYSTDVTLAPTGQSGMAVK